MSEELLIKVQRKFFNFSFLTLNSSLLTLKFFIFQLPPPKTSTLANTQTGEPCPTQIA